MHLSPKSVLKNAYSSVIHMHSTTSCHPVMVEVLLLLLTAFPSNDFFIITTLCTQTSHISCQHQMLNDQFLHNTSAVNLLKVYIKYFVNQKFALLLSLDLILYLILWVSDMLHGCTSITMKREQHDEEKEGENEKKDQDSLEVEISRLVDDYNTNVFQTNNTATVSLFGDWGNIISSQLRHLGSLCWFIWLLWLFGHVFVYL